MMTPYVKPSIYGIKHDQLSNHFKNSHLTLSHWVMVLTSDGKSLT